MTHLRAPIKGVANVYLRRARELKGWSQGHVARLIDTSPVNISRWECGRTLPGPYFRQKLCAVFEQSATELGLIRETIQVAPATAPLEVAGVGYIPSHDLTVGLPKPVARTLVGRDELLTDLKQRLCSGEHKTAVAMYGLPGVGKTALAARLTHSREITQHFSGGVLWAGLGKQPNILTLLSTWSAVVGARSLQGEPPNVEAHMRAIREAIGDRRMLLVIDDVWAFTDAVIFNVLGPYCGALLTTRFPDIALRVAGKNAVRVEELSEGDGLLLLEQLAPQIVATEPVEARKLVQSVGGLPLALMLLGEYIHVHAYGGQPRRLHAALAQMSNAEERLRLSSIRLPENPSVDASLGAPLSLRAVIELSEQGISTDARHALYALSLFPPKPASFSESAALAVTAMGLQALDELIDAGLLEGHGAGRYTLHQTIADYAQIKFADNAAYSRMVTYFTRYVEEHGRDFRAVETEEVNILAALELASRCSDNLLAPCICSFAPYLEAQGLYGIAKTHLSRAEKVALASHDDDRLASIWLRLGRLAELSGDLARAEEIYELGLEKAGKTHQHEIMCTLLTHRGEVAIARGDYQRANGYLRKGLRINRAVGDTRRAGMLLRLLGEVADCGGNYVNGDKLYLRALVFAREADDRETISALLQNLGEKALKRGDISLAERYLNDGLRSAYSTRHFQRISALLADLGALSIRQGHLDQAEWLIQESLSLAQSIGHPIRMITASLSMAKLEEERANYNQAVTRLRASLEMACSIGHPFLTAECLIALGEVQLKEKQSESAASVFEQALALAERVAAHELAARSLYGLARLAAERGQYAEAERYAQSCQEKFTTEGHELADEVNQWRATLPLICFGHERQRKE